MLLDRDGAPSAQPFRRLRLPFRPLRPLGSRVSGAAPLPWCDVSGPRGVAKMTAMALQGVEIRLEDITSATIDTIVDGLSSSNAGRADLRDEWAW